MSSAAGTVSAESTAVSPVAKSVNQAESSPEKSADPPVEKSEAGNHVVADGDAPSPAKKAKTDNEPNGAVKEKSAKKKVSQLERTRAEAEALIGDLKKDGGEESGGRRTRSQTRGTPPKSVVPEKVTRSPRAAKSGRTESPAAAAPKKTPTSGRSRSRNAKKAPVSDDEVAEKKDAPETADQKSEESEAAEKPVVENGQKGTDSEASEKEEEKKEETDSQKDASKTDDADQSSATSESEAKSASEPEVTSADAPVADPVAEKTD